MGKADNIRRAKKLKEAKRQRELEMQFPKNGNKDLQTIFNRNKGDRMNLFNDSEIKFSGIILEFLKPYLWVEDTENVTKLKIAIGIFAWNFSVEEQLGIANEEVVSEFGSLLVQVESGQEMFDDLLIRKKTNFSEYEFVVSDFIIGKASKGQVQLSVAVSVLEED